MATLNPTHVGRTTVVAPRASRTGTAASTVTTHTVRTPWGAAVVAFAVGAAAAVGTAVALASTVSISVPLH